MPKPASADAMTYHLVRNPVREVKMPITRRSESGGQNAEEAKAGS